MSSHQGQCCGNCKHNKKPSCPEPPDYVFEIVVWCNAWERDPQKPLLTE